MTDGSACKYWRQREQMRARPILFILEFALEMLEDERSILIQFDTVKVVG